MASQLDYLKVAPVVRSMIKGRPRMIFVDTGSSISLIQPGVSVSKLNQAIVTPFGVTGDELRVKGEQRVTFTVNGKEFVHAFCVCTIATEADAILRMDFLTKAEACVDFENRQLHFKETAKIDHDPQAGECCEVRETTACVALTVFSRTDGVGSKRNSRMCGDNRQSELPQIQTEISKSTIELEDSEPWLVKTTKNIRVPPRVKQMIVGRVELPRRQEAPPLFCVEPAQLPNEGILAARGLSPVLPSADQTAAQPMTLHGTREAQLTNSCRRAYVHVMVVNFSQEEIVLPKLQCWV